MPFGTYGSGSEADVADIEFTQDVAQDRIPGARTRAWAGFVRMADGAFTLALLLGMGFWCYKQIGPDASGVTVAHGMDAPMRAQPGRLTERPTDSRGSAPPDGGLITAPPPVEIALEDIPIKRFFRPALRSEMALATKVDKSAQADAADALIVRISSKDAPVSDPVLTVDPVANAIDVTAIPEVPEPAPVLSHVSQGVVVSLRPQGRPVDITPFILGPETAQPFVTPVDIASALSPGLAVSLRPLKRSIEGLSPVTTAAVIQTSVLPSEMGRSDAPAEPSVAPVETYESSDEALTDFNQWLEQFGDSPASQTITVNRDMGGGVYHYAWKVAKAAQNGSQVRIRGACVSACTLFLAMPKDQVCITHSARFSFHMPYGKSRTANRQAAEYMMRKYPQWVRNWIVSKGGLTRKMIHMGSRYASQFMNVCGSQPAPVYVSAEPAVETLLTAAELSAAPTTVTRAPHSNTTPSLTSFEPKRVSARTGSERERQFVEDR